MSERDVLDPIVLAAIGSAGSFFDIKVSAGASSTLRSDFTFSNSNGVSFGLAANGIITGTVATNYQSAGAYLTTAALSQDSSKYAGTNGAITGGSITVNTSGVSVNLPAYLTTAMLSNAATISNINVSAGATSNNLSALTFNNSNGISFGLTGSVITGTVATNYQSQGAYLTTAALSGDSSKYAFTGFTTTTIAGDVVAGTQNTLGLKLAVPAYLTTAQAPGAYLTTAALSQDSSKYAGINGAITGGSITVNTSGVSINLPAYLTTAALSGDTTKYAGVGESVGTVAGTDLGLTVNTDGVSILYPKWLTTAQASGAYLTTAALSADSSKYAFTGFTTTTVAGAVIAGTHNTDGLLLAVPSFLTTAQSAGAYLTTAALSGDTSKYAFTGFTTTTIAGAVIAGTHNTDGLKLAVPGYLTTAALSANTSNYAGINSAITGGSMTVNTSGISINLPAYLTTAALSADSSKYAGTGFTTATSAGVAIVGTQNTAGLSMGVPAYITTAALSTLLSEFNPFPGVNPAQSGLGLNSLYFAPFELQQSLSAYRLNLFHSFATTLSASNQTGTGGMTVSAMLYSRGVGASTERLMSLWSGSWYMTYSNSSNSALSISHPMGISNSTAISTSQYSVNNATVTDYLANSIAGMRVVPLPVSLTLNPNRYWIAVAGSTNTVSTKYQVLASMAMGNMGNNFASAFAPFGTSTGANNGGMLAGLGTYSATSAAFPVSVALSVSDIRPIATAPFFNFSAYTTATNLL